MGHIGFFGDPNEGLGLNGFGRLIRPETQLGAFERAIYGFSLWFKFFHTGKVPPWVFPSED